jgi:hypothetical protein
LQAAFDGALGWFWRQGSEGEVTEMLSKEREYSEVKRVL